MSRNRFEGILGSLRYTDRKDIKYYYGLFHMRQMEESWNLNTAEEFNPSWINVLDGIMMEWFNKYAPGFMCVERKPYPFGNERHTISCGLTSILWRAQIVEGKDRPQQIGQREYNELGKTVSLMLRMCRPIFGSGKDVVLDSGFCVAKVIAELEAKGVYAAALIKKRHYGPKGVLGGLVDTHFEDKDVGCVGMIEARTEDNKLFKIFCMKEPYYVMKIMVSWMTFDELEGARTGRYFIDSSGTKETKHFTYRQPFGIHFRYGHQVDDHNNWRHVPISLERKWATKFWPDRNFSWYLSESEVNTALVSGHFQNDGVVQPSLDFGRALVIECLGNTIGVELGENGRPNRTSKIPIYVPCE